MPYTTETLTVLIAAIQADGFDAALSRLEASDPALARLLMLESGALAPSLPVGAGSEYIAQQIRSRAHHEGMDDLAAACDVLLQGALHFAAPPASRYPTHPALIRVLRGHSTGVIGARQLDDGRLLSWSADGSARLWTADGAPLAVMNPGRGEPIVTVLRLNDGRLMLQEVYGVDGIWLCTPTGQMIGRLEHNLSKIITSYQVADGRVLILSNKGRTLNVWSADLRSQKALALPDLHPARWRMISGDTALRDGRLATGDEGGGLYLWSADGDLLRELPGHTDAVSSILELRDGRLLSWSNDGTLRVWSADGDPLAVRPIPGEQFYQAVELRDGRWLSWSSDTTLRLWSADGDPLAVLTGHTNFISKAIELDDGRLLSLSNDATLRLWSPDGEPLAVLTGHQGRIMGVTKLSGGRLLSSAAFDGTLRVWSPEGETLAVLYGHAGNSAAALVLRETTAAGAEQALSWSDDGTLRIWDLSALAGPAWGGHHSAVRGMLLLPDRRVLSWSSDAALHLWAADGSLIATLAGHTDEVQGAALLADGRMLSWSRDMTLRLWGADGEALAVLSGHTRAVAGAWVQADGRIFSWSYDKTLRVWSPDGEAVATLTGHSGPIHGAWALADGRICAVAANGLMLWTAQGALLENTRKSYRGMMMLSNGHFLAWTQNAIEIWSGRARQIGGDPDAHRYLVEGAAALHDGRFITWGYDSTIHLRGQDGTLMATFQDRAIGILALPQGGAQPGAPLFLSWQHDGTMRLWRASGTPIAVLIGHAAKVAGALTLPDGRILSWSEDCTLRLWSAYGEALAVLHTEAPARACVAIDSRHIVYGDAAGRVVALTLGTGEPAPAPSVDQGDPAASFASSKPSAETPPSAEQRPAASAFSSFTPPPRPNPWQSLQKQIRDFWKAIHLWFWAIFAVVAIVIRVTMALDDVRRLAPEASQPRLLTLPTMTISYSPAWTPYPVSLVDLCNGEESDLICQAAFAHQNDEVTVLIGNVLMEEQVNIEAIQKAFDSMDLSNEEAEVTLTRTEPSVLAGLEAVRAYYAITPINPLDRTSHRFMLTIIAVQGKRGYWALVSSPTEASYEENIRIVQRLLDGIVIS